MSLPANMSYCLVKGRLIRVVLDGSDEGREPPRLLEPPPSCSERGL